MPIFDASKVPAADSKKPANVPVTPCPGGEQALTANKDKSDNDGGGSSGEDEDESEDGYDLIKILSASEVTGDQIICHKEDCSLRACCVYVSSNAASKEKWYYCLDCQEEDFDGKSPLSASLNTY